MSKNSFLYEQSDVVLKYASRVESVLHSEHSESVYV